ncbi:MAG: hypothetical protein HYS26_00455 [Candidatus Kaiserbacteria bacterium]|nr:MAG: hypothetical protein HYS26_00455 [Candidatus Kaiserbacteria bacterium]
MKKIILLSVVFAALSMSTASADPLKEAVDAAVEAAPTVECVPNAQLENYCFVKVRNGENVVAIAIKPLENRLRFSWKVIGGKFKGQNERVAGR